MISKLFLCILVLLVHACLSSFTSNPQGDHGLDQLSVSTSLETKALSFAEMEFTGSVGTDSASWFQLKQMTSCNIQYGLSGIYTLTRNLTGMPPYFSSLIPTYCDMDHDDGCWQLVSSVWSADANSSHVNAEMRSLGQFPVALGSFSFSQFRVECERNGTKLHRTYHFNTTLYNLVDIHNHTVVNVTYYADDNSDVRPGTFENIGTVGEMLSITENHYFGWNKDGVIRRVIARIGNPHCAGDYSKENDLTEGNGGIGYYLRYWIR